MRHPTATRRQSATDPGTLPAQANAVLFYHLARFVAWGTEHRQITAADPDLCRLVECATEALAGAGVRD